MKIVVIGGSGLIGKKLVKNLRQQGHEVVAASPSLGVNTVTGEGLAQALAGAQVVVDVANAPSWEDKAVLEFFETAGRNLLAAEAAAGVSHHVALSIVGADRLPASGYLRAKVAQENVIKALTDVAVAEPLNGTVVVAGPEPIRMDEFARRFLSATRDPRKMITDAHALYFGTELNDQSLVPGPGDNPRLGPTHYEEWLSRSTS